MNRILTNFSLLKKTSFGLFLLLTLLTFQQGIAQHCTPGFHASIDQNTVTFDDISTADGTITGYSWNFGDGQTSTEQNPVHTYAAPGTYNVCLTITAHNPDCTETFCHHIVIVHPPAGVCHAAFSAHQPDPEQTVVDFTDQSTSDGTIGSWSWDFGDGSSSTDQNPSHTYAAPGTYLVCLVITDADGGCTNHICHHVVVHHPPAGVCHALFSAHQTDPNQTVIDFTDQSTSDGAIGSWSWDFGDGNTSSEQNPSHTYAAPGTYIVCLNITDADGGCTSHFCHHVVVHHPPASICHASFTYHTDGTTLEVQLTNTSTGTTGQTTYYWTFGDGATSTLENPDHTYAHSGHYIICLFLEDASTGCSSHFCHVVNIHFPGGGHDYNSFHHPIITAEPDADTDPGGHPNKPVHLGNYPNPFIGFTTIEYEIPVAATVRMELLHLNGIKIAGLVEGERVAGLHTEVIQAGLLLPGQYLIKMTVDGKAYTRIISVQ